MRKKLFTCLIALAAMLTFSPQAWGAIVINPEGAVTESTPFTIYHASTTTGSYYGRFEITWVGYGSSTKPILQYRIINGSGKFESNGQWRDMASGNNIKSEKCTNGNTYFVLSTSTSSSYPSGLGIQIRLKSGQTYTPTASKYLKFTFKYNTTNQPLGLAGNIMSLVTSDYENCTEIPSTYCFYNLFEENASNQVNVNAQELILPATTLKSHCYENMFSALTSYLVAGPQIKALSPEDCSFSSDCFKNMFKGCSNMASLTTYFLTWGTGANTTDWVYGCSKLTTVNCPSNLEKTKDASHIGTAYTSGSTITPNCYVFNVSENGGSWSGGCTIDSIFTTSAPSVANPVMTDFAGWFTAATGGAQVNPSSLPVPSGVVTYYAQATPAASDFHVTVNDTEHGTVNVYVKDSDPKKIVNGQDVAAGTELVIEAVPAVGYKLSAWTDDAIDLTINPSFKLASDVTIGATFVEDLCSLTIANPTPAGYGTLAASDGDESYLPGNTYPFNRQTDNGKVITFTATPAAQRMLDAWVDTKEVLTNKVGNTAQLTITNTMEDVTIGATFSDILYTVNATSTNGTVRLTATDYETEDNIGRYAYNTTVQMKANANKYYKFVKWSDEVTLNPRNITITGDVTISAVFEEAPASNIGMADVYQDGTGKHTNNMKKILYSLDATTGTDGITYTPIDMGYGVAWADKNIGATDADPKGGYFYFGGITPVAKANWPNLSSYYTNINNMPANSDLPKEADAAYQIMGDNTWRIPTKDDWQKVLNNVYGQTYTSVSSNLTGNTNTARQGDGVITSLENGTNSITLPKTGRVYDQTYTQMDNYCCYWSSTINGSPSAGTTHAWTLYMHNGRSMSGTTQASINGVKCLYPIRAIYSPEFETRTLTINTKNGGSTYTYVYVCEKGQKVEITTNPLVGYIFDKWSEDNNTDAIRTFTVTENMSYTATFKQPEPVALAWDLQGGTVKTAGSEEKSYTPGTAITAPVVEKTGYTFTGWEPAFTGSMPASATTYVAQWQLNTYTITWKNYNDETLETDENVEYGATPKYNGDTPTRADDAAYSYTFTGWSPTIATVTDNATYTAQFEATPLSTPFELKDDKYEGDPFYTTLNNLAGKEKNVQYMRTFPAGTPDVPSWSAFSLPFDYPIEDDPRFNQSVLSLDYATYDDVTGTLTLYFLYQDTYLSANKPYIFYNKGAVLENPIFNGVKIVEPAKVTDEYADCAPQGKVYFKNTIVRGSLADDPNIAFLYDNKLYYSGSGNTMRAFRGYFEMDGVVDADSSAPRRIVMMVDETTGLTSEMEVTSINTKKVIEGGILYIERNGVRYDAQGATIK